MEQKYSQLHKLVKEFLQEAVSDAIETKYLIFDGREDKSKDLLDDFINAEEAAKFLHIAKQTLYTLTSKRKIPFYKKGKKLLFKRQELEEWISVCKREDHHKVIKGVQDSNSKKS